MSAVPILPVIELSVTVSDALIDFVRESSCVIFPFASIATAPAVALTRPPSKTPPPLFVISTFPTAFDSAPRFISPEVVLRTVIAPLALLVIEDSELLIF